MIPLATIEGYASQFAGTPITISCPASETFADDLLGYVVFIDDQVVATIHLPRQTCINLEYADTSNSLDSSDFLTLTHEATHIALNSQDECRVAKTALANTWQVVRRFKLAAWRTRMILAGLTQADDQLQPLYHEGCR